MVGTPKQRLIRSAAIWCALLLARAVSSSLSLSRTLRIWYWLELMSTLSGEPLYTAYGFRPIERLEDATGGVPVPIIRMAKPIDASLLG